MGIKKSRGKHAQGAHAQQAVPQPQPQKFEERELPRIEVSAPTPDETVAIDASATQASEPAKTPVDLPAVRIEDFVGNTAAKPASEPFVPTAIPEGAAYGDGSVLPNGVVLHKKRNVGKIVGMTFGIIIGVLLVIYIVGAIVFMNLFFPRTSIAGRDISLMTNGDVAKMLNDEAAKYSIDVSGNGYTYRTTASDINLSVDGDGIVNAMHADLNAWTWPYLLFQDQHDESDLMAVSFSKTAYEPQVTKTLEEFNKTATPPTDATISYDPNTKKFNVVPEVAGTMYDTQAVLSSMNDAISQLDSTVTLTSDQLVQPKVFSDDERLVNSAELATGLVSAHVTLTMAGLPVADINGDSLSAFIRVDETLGVTLDEVALDQWVTALSNGFDTVGTERTYVRADGKEITIGGGVYGWSTDAPALKDQVVAAIKSGTTTTIDIPCEQTAAAYNGPGQRDWGNRYIDVDISEQYVHFFGDDGSVIWEAPCISGSPDGLHDTVPGVWMVNSKESPSKLVGYENGVKQYETTVTYWMPFEGIAIGFHDATWQPSFGGDMYASGYGSHGCVNLSYDAAESLFDIIEVGDCVVVHY